MSSQHSRYCPKICPYDVQGIPAVRKAWSARQTPPDPKGDSPIGQSAEDTPTLSDLKRTVIVLLGGENMDIKKRDGSTEVFMPEKVVVSAVKSGASYEVAKEIASSLTSRTEETMASSEIREYVLTELRSRGASSAADSWESYDRERKERS
ncbi:MAG: ATP cone domain-containing protein [Promethearchaeota archaeon]